MFSEIININLSTFNGKIYGSKGDYSIYINSEKTSITNEQAKQLSTYCYIAKIGNYSDPNLPIVAQLARIGESITNIFELYAEFVTNHSPTSIICTPKNPAMAEEFLFNCRIEKIFDSIEDGAPDVGYRISCVDFVYYCEIYDGRSITHLVRQDEIKNR